MPANTAYESMRGISPLRPRRFAIMLNLPDVVCDATNSMAWATAERNYGHDNGRHDSVNGGKLHARQRNFVRPSKPDDRTEPIARNNSACGHGANNADKQ